MSETDSSSWIGLLVDHHTWATLELLSFCERLTAEQLVATAPGTFGTIFETLHHFIESSGHYVVRLAPELWPPDMPTDANDAWTASIGGREAFEWVRDGGPEESRIERRRQAFLSGDLAEALALLRARVEVVDRTWRAYLDSDPDPGTPIAIPRWSYASAPVVLAAMSIGHADEHREQIRSILTSIGIEPPDSGAMRWAETRGLLKALA